MKVSREQILGFRASASHLDARLPAGSHAKAAYGGLQDSAPRAALISLNARIEGCEPTSWDHPSLAQIWFRGGADYVIPRADVGVFTLGSLPRDADACAAIDALTDRALDVLQGRTLKVREVSEALALEHPTAIRSTAASGRVLIRWDASNIWLIPNERPDIDAEDARLELARRFLSWFGPQTKQRFTWWTAGKPRDSTVTWRALADELTEVEVHGETRHILARDLDALRTAHAPSGVRLVPSSDPYTRIDAEVLLPNEDERRRVWVHGQSPVAGVVLVDGEVAGTWQRQQRKVTIDPWRKLPRDEIEREALSLPIASKQKPAVSWQA